MIAGACGGIAGVITGHPLDTLKVLVTIKLAHLKRSENLYHWIDYNS